MNTSIKSGAVNLTEKQLGGSELISFNYLHNSCIRCTVEFVVKQGFGSGDAEEDGEKDSGGFAQLSSSQGYTEEVPSAHCHFKTKTDSRTGL